MLAKRPRLMETHELIAAAAAARAAAPESANARSDRITYYYVKSCVEHHGADPMDLVRATNKMLAHAQDIQDEEQLKRDLAVLLEQGPDETDGDHESDDHEESQPLSQPLSQAEALSQGSNRR